MTDPVPNLPRLGGEGETCSACQAPLAVDQRYCLQCGKRRGASRVDFGELLPLEPAAGGAAPAMVATDPRFAAQSPWTPFAIVASIATLGLMVLVGVMIGKDDSPSQITAAAAPVAPLAAASTAPAGSGAASGGGGAAKGAGAGGDAAKAKTASEKGGGGGGGATKQPVTAPASDAPGAETIDDGALDALDGATGQDAADASKNLPDTIALPGDPPPVDNEAPGGGGSAQVIK